MRASSATIAIASVVAALPSAICAPTNDPAEVPTIRSACSRFTPPSAKPARRPDSHAIPTGPPPPRISARFGIEDAPFMNVNPYIPTKAMLPTMTEPPGLQRCQPLYRRLGIGQDGRAALQFRLMVDMS